MEEDEVVKGRRESPDEASVAEQLLLDTIRGREDEYREGFKVQERSAPTRAEITLLVRIESASNVMMM